MVIRGSDGALYWQADDGSVEPYTGQDGGTPPPPGQQGGLTVGDAGGQGLGIGAGVGGGYSGGLGGTGGGNGLNLGPTPVAPAAPPPAAPPVGAPANDYPTWGANLGETGAAPWATSQALGIPFQTWLDQYQAAQATAAQNAARLASGSSAASGISAAASMANAAAANAENKRQFDLAQTTPTAYQQGVLANDAATRAYQQQQLAQQRDTTLLNLGTNPSTLIKYLHAIQGVNTPQFLLDKVNNQNVIGQPGGAGAGTSSPSLVPPAGTASLNLPPQDFGGAQAGGMQVPPMTPAQVAFRSPSVAAGVNGVDQANAFNQANATPTLGAPTPLTTMANTGNGMSSTSTATLPTGTRIVPPSLANPTGIIGPTSTTPMLSTTDAWTQQRIADRASQTPEQLAAQDASAGAADDRLHGYAQGGLIPEKVVGIGQDSGQTYEFGEKGTEAVVSNDMLERLMQVAGKVDLHQKSADGKSQRFSFTLNSAPKKKEVTPVAPSTMDGSANGTNSFADGGSIGYDPTNAPTLGGNASGFFNSPNLKTMVDRGFDSTGTPLFPQIGIATNGGQSLIPSIQRLNSLLPSEQSLYGGAVNEFGGNSADTFALSKSLAPGANNLKTPAFTN